MTFSPKRPCKKPGCSALLGVGEGTYCPKHRTAPQAEARVLDRFRGTAAERGYGAEWRKESRQFLALNPICLGVTRANAVCNQLATIVDHIIPHKGDMALFWDKKNWQSLCKKCHDRKTAREDRGAWVPARKPAEAGCL